MNRNPYSPPVAAVADEAAAPRPMPPAVRNALILMAASFVLHFAIIAAAPRAADAQGTGQIAGAMLVSVVVTVLITIALTLWLGWKIAVGRNWARIVLLVLTIISVPVAFVGIVRLASTWPLGAGLSVVEQGMDIAVVCLLFIPGRAYFRK
jgi:membrane protease YdiL (CAAX protease family)